MALGCCAVWLVAEIERSQIMSFEEWEAERLSDPEFRKAAEEKELAYQFTRLKIIFNWIWYSIMIFVGNQYVWVRDFIERIKSKYSQ